MDGVTEQTDASAAIDATLYQAHLCEKMSRFQALLKGSGFTALLISSGEFLAKFQDDLDYPFKANPYFREWVPLAHRPGCFLLIQLGEPQPQLFLNVAEDIWHTEPQALPPAYDANMQVCEYSQLNTIEGECKKHKALAYIGDTNPFKLTTKNLNPSALLAAIDFQRLCKTPYEQACVRQANRLAVPAHRAAYKAFINGASELAISQAYLQVCGCMESDMPYSIIAGLNENAAVLHHYRLSNKAPLDARSFLIDAGVECQGYASDITRTYAKDEGSDFAAMIQRLDAEQRQFVAAGAIGSSPADIHRQSHRAVTSILKDFGVITVSLEEAMHAKLSESFYPHGLGHHLGCNVHDKGGQYKNAQGDTFQSPADYPRMKHLAPMVAGQVYTVEPGIYFIPGLLNKLRDSEHGNKINWPQVKAFLPYGGIRIEDNIILHGDGRLENMTREAFAAE